MAKKKKSDLTLADVQAAAAAASASSLSDLHLPVTDPDMLAELEADGLLTRAETPVASTETPAPADDADAGLDAPGVASETTGAPAAPLALVVVEDGYVCAGGMLCPVRAGTVLRDGTHDLEGALEAMRAGKVQLRVQSEVAS